MHAYIQMYTCTSVRIQQVDDDRAVSSFPELRNVKQTEQRSRRPKFQVELPSIAFRVREFQVSFVFEKEPFRAELTQLVIWYTE